MSWQIDPPLEGRHKLAILLMVLAAAVAVGLVNFALVAEENREAVRWNEVHHERR